MRYFLGGVNGAGKSTFIQTLAEVEPSFEVVHVTGRLMSYLAIAGDYNKLRNLPQQELRKDLYEVYRIIFEEQQKPHIIADSHYLNTRWGEISRVTDSWIEQFDALLLLSADANTIYTRVMKDQSQRDRALFKPSLTNAEQLKFYSDYLAQTEAEYHRLRELYDLPGISIDTSDSPEQSVEDFLKFHSSISSRP